jgi:hypothetical protein
MKYETEHLAKLPRKAEVSGGVQSAGENWCQRQELNLRPKAYESSALPLSYSGSQEVRHFIWFTKANVSNANILLA